MAVWFSGNDGAKGGPDTTSVHFADTKPHALRLELLHSGDDKGIALEWIPPAGALLEEALRAASGADVVIACVGLSPDLEGEALQVELPGFAGGDRTSLDLPETQLRLLERLRSLHKKTVIVLTSGSAVALGPLADAAGAVLEVWYPGESGGTALADLLSGKANPSGRLPVTFYRSVDDLPAFTDYSMARRTYRYFQRPVEYPFGFGLSYTHFVYSDLRVSSERISAGMLLTVYVTVRNAGSPEGAGVSELYVAAPLAPGAPRMALRGIQRVMLRAGESRELQFRLAPEQMSIVNEQGERLESAGDYRIFVGGAQPDLMRTPSVRLTVIGSKDISSLPEAELSRTP